MQQLSKISLIFFLLYMHAAWAVCPISIPAREPAPQMSDPIASLLRSDGKCPLDVFAFRQQLIQSGFKLETTLVANQGFHNPAEGSFSLFEIVSGKSIQPGDFFFGHFTTINEEGYLAPAQNPHEKSLMIEALAWDVKKEMFNFYELRSDGKEAKWFYRGDSADILADNHLLHRQPDPRHPVFGKDLRCSACHDAGGPIMKELAAPHNDWWEPVRKLDFGGRHLDASLEEILTTLVPAERLNQSVLQGLKKLEASKTLSQRKSALSLQEQLRPLFCPVELNFKSDHVPNENAQPDIAIPAEFFVSGLLLSDNTKDVIISRNHYEAALNAADSHFPGTTLKDADHAWLTPVKARSDQMAINTLISRHIITEKFAADVLSIDMANPVFSAQRCALLQLVPDVFTTNWQEIFIHNLSQSQNTAAKELLDNLLDHLKTPEYHRQQAERFLTNCRTSLTNINNVEQMYQLLIQRRAEIKASEISSNPLGQILEPGFRVIFPETKISAVPGKLKLDAGCGVIN